MKKAHVNVVFNKKKTSQRTGLGLVEVCVYFARNQRRYFPVRKIEPYQWPSFGYSPEVQAVVSKCEKILEIMEILNKPMTIETFLELYASDSEQKESSCQKNESPSATKNSFLDFFFDELGHEKIAPRTRQARMVVYNTLLRFDRIHTFDDLTPAHILELHKFIQGEAPRRPQNLSDGDDIESLQRR